MPVLAGSQPAPNQPDQPAPPHLERRIGLASAVSLNMMYMIGVGPFITLPLIVTAMGGSQAMLGWLLGALIAVCDGLVWAELGAAMPEAGGSYAFLREIYGRDGAGRYASFLYIFQLGFSAPLSIASGCIGFAAYASYLFPRLRNPLFSAWPNGIHYTSLLAASACAVIVVMLYRTCAPSCACAWVLWAGVMATMALVLFAGFTHFHPALLQITPHSINGSASFFAGLASASLIATYDYWGYYNVCFLGGEIKKPGKTIPRAILFSIAAVATLYIAMNVSVLGVIPAQPPRPHRRRRHGRANPRPPRRHPHRLPHHVDRLLLRLRPAHRLFARPLRRRARRQLLPRLRPPAPAPPFS